MFSVMIVVLDGLSRLCSRLVVGVVLVVRLVCFNLVR